MSVIADLLIKSSQELFGDAIKSALEFVGLITWQQARWIRAADAYKEKSERLHSVIYPISTQDKKIDVRDIYTHLYFLRKPAAQQVYDETAIAKIVKKRGRHQLAEGERVRASDVLIKHPKLFVLGQPGSGKTTLLRKAFLAGLEGDLPDQRLPVFVELRNLNLNPGWTLIDLIVQQFDVCNFPEKEIQPFLEWMLKNGRLYVLIDGLDEVPQEEKRRSAIHKDIENFTTKYDKCRYIVSSRIAATTLTLRDFEYIEIADFDRAQIEEFAQSWFKPDEDITQRFIQTVVDDDNNSYAALTINPLLLSMLCNGFEKPRELPKERGPLYRHLTQHILYEREKHKDGLDSGRDGTFASLSLTQKTKLLAHVAFHGFIDEKLVWEQKDLAQQLTVALRSVANLEARDDLAFLMQVVTQSGLFVERAKKHYTFAHLTFQEFYTAEYITSGGLPYAELIEKYGEDPRWREVILLVASLLTKPAPVKEFFAAFIVKLNAIVADNVKLQAVINRDAIIMKKASQSRRALAVRLYLLASALDGARDRVFALDSAIASARARAFAIDSAIDSARARAIASTRARVSALARASTRANTRVRAITRVITSTRASTGIRASVLAPALALDYSLIWSELSALNAFSEDVAHDQIQNLGLRQLEFVRQHAALRQDDVLVQQIEKAQHFVEEKNWSVLEKLLDELNVSLQGSTPDLDAQELERLARYAEQLNLCIDCLQLARMSPQQRDAIYDQLLVGES